MKPKHNRFLPSASNALSQQKRNPLLSRSSILLSALTLTVLTSGQAYAQVFNVTAGGAQNWNTAGNWNPATIPNAIGATADISLDLASNLTLSLTAPITVGSLTTNDTGAASDSTIQIQNNTLTFQVSTGNATFTNTNANTTIIESSVTLGSNLTVANSGGSILRFGNGATNTISLGSNTLTLQDSGAGAVTIGVAANATRGLITGTGGIVVNRTSTTAQTNLNNASSTYSGGTTLNNGFLLVTGSSTGVGSGVTAGVFGTGTVTINAATSVRLRGSSGSTLGNNILLQSDVFLGAGGSTENLTLAGNITLDATGKQIITESLTATGQIISGAIGQSASGYTLRKAGGGTLRFSGTTANTYTGSTDVTNGVLELGKTAGVNAIAGNLSISTGTPSRVVLIASNQIADTSAVFLSGAATSGVLRLNSFSETIGSLASTGGAGVVENNTSGTSTLTVSAASGSTTFSGVLQNGAAGVLAFTKEGAATQTLTGTSTYTGATNVNAGSLVVNGNISTSSLTTVAPGATLGGDGTVGAATINGILAPGNSIGTLNATGDVTWNDNDSWVFELATAAATLALANSTPGLSDLLNITGSGNDFIKGTGTSFTFDFVNGGTVGWYKLVDWESTTTFGASDFSATNLSSGLTGAFTVDSGTSALYLNVIPEPSAALLGGLGVLALLRRRRNA